MVRFLTALCLVAAPLILANAADDPKEYASKDGKFTANFPGEVKTSESKAKKGEFVVYTAMSQPKPGHVYTVTYFDLPIEIPADKVKETLPMLTAGIKGKTLSDMEITLGKNKTPGRESVIEMTNAHLRMLIFLDGKRVYQVIVGGPGKDDVTSKDADKFVKSFAITK